MKTTQHSTCGERESARGARVPRREGRTRYSQFKLAGPEPRSASTEDARATRRKAVELCAIVLERVLREEARLVSIALRGLRSMLWPCLALIAALRG